MMVYECESLYIPSIDDAVKLTSNGRCDVLIVGETKPRFGTVINIYKQNDKFYIGLRE